jgi:hypothetical protein
VDAFGLTTDRLYAAAFMAWVAISLIWFGATVIRGRPKPFASGALAAAIVTVFGLGALNPHGLVARTNLSRADTQVVDYAYLWTLEGDAIPRVVTTIDAIPSEAERCAAVRRALRRWGPAPDGKTLADRADWRRWNAGTAGARDAVAAVLPRLEAIADGCPKSVAPANDEPANTAPDGG